MTTATRHDADPERGTAAVFTILLVLVMFTFAGLLFDVGHAIDERTQAANIAGEAARKVADDVSIPDLRAGTITIDTAQCFTKADQIITAYGTGEVTGCTVAGRDVTVSVAIPYHPVLLTLGITFVARATAHVHLAAGITTGS